jgi:hypothetical protein
MCSEYMRKSSKNPNAGFKDNETAIAETVDDGTWPSGMRKYKTVSYKIFDLDGRSKIIPVP